MLSPEALSEILSVLYEAPSEPARWQDFLRLLSSAVAGEAGALLMHHFRDVRSAMSAEWGFHPDVSKLYAAHYGSIDVWRSATTASSDWLGISEQFVSVAELSRTEFYNDLLLPYGIEHGMFAMVERAPGRVANLSICRSARRGPFEEKDLATLRILTPHVRRAYRLHCELAGAQACGTGLLAAINSLASGVVILDIQMHVMTMNEEAERMVSAGNGLRVCRQRLTAEHAGGAMTISRLNRPALELLVTPIRSTYGSSGGIATLVFIHDPAKVRRPPPEMLRGFYHLTPAECRVALLLGDGHSTSQIAEMLGVTNNTVRTQIKSIFSKTGVKRQSQLVSLLLNNASFVQPKST